VTTLRFLFNDVCSLFSAFENRICSSIHKNASGNKTYHTSFSIFTYTKPWLTLSNYLTCFATQPIAAFQKLSPKTCELALVLLAERIIKLIIAY